MQYNIKKRFVAIGFFVMLFVQVKAQTITFTINVKNKAQTIQNIGASGAWYSEAIGKYWPQAKKDRMAELLFSKGFDSLGNPLGIGLSAWRFNIGGGTAEQGDSSGIFNPEKRVECFLQPNGSYNWDKQKGYMWFVKKAVSYGVENLIAFSNTPPVQFTKNGLGFNLSKNFQTNLKEDKYSDYASFLATVIQHFKSEGIAFNYINPVNEPQWDWSSEFGKMSQEGTPWLNKDIYKIAVCLDSALDSKGLNTQIMLPEAGTLTALYDGKDHASKQIQNFFSLTSKNYLGGLKHLLPAIAGHSYFTEYGDSNLVTVRQKLRDTVKAYKVPFWQSEYSMLGDGYKDGKSGVVSAMDCALFLAKVIHNDFVVANASAWHFWNAWEPGRANAETRYYLLALRNRTNTQESDFAITKNLWALGHFSRFIRPGMHRINTQRSDGLNDIDAAKNVMLSSYTDGKEIVIVAINYSTLANDITLKIKGHKRAKLLKHYITTASEDNDMKVQSVNVLNNIVLHPRSISTFVLKYMK
jgi:O-glycosyl hydrolase